jgi:hypothetical protein
MTVIETCSIRRFRHARLVPGIRVFAAFPARRLTPVTLTRNSHSSPFA